MERAREAIQKEIEEEVENRLWKIKKSLMEPAQGAPFYSSSGSLELRRKYASMTAAEAVLEIFNNSVGIFNQKMTKVNKIRFRHMACFLDQQLPQVSSHGTMKSPARGYHSSKISQLVF